MADASRWARRLVGVYDADGGIIGELRYVWNRAVRHQHCSLCDITHSGVRPKRAWSEFVERLGVPFELYHRNDQPTEVARVGGTVPCVLAEVGGQLVRLLEPDDLESVHGDVAAFERLVRHAAERAGMAFPVGTDTPNPGDSFRGDRGAH